MKRKKSYRILRISRGTNGQFLSPKKGKIELIKIPNRC